MTVPTDKPVPPVLPDQAEFHHYLSTACFHALEDHTPGASVAELHGYCKSDTGLGGQKNPGHCKWCGVQCICPCHQEGLDA